MNDKATLFNPFPGLRSFRSDEDHLFFGREEQTLELMSHLERNRFIAVVGSSGRGKSSLVRCGLLSRLQGGGLARAGAHWEIAVMHPGGDPLRHLADALLEAGLYDRAEDDAVPHLLATLGRSQFGLVEAVRQAAQVRQAQGPAAIAGLPAGTNFLLVVDQFEEIFRYDEAGAAESEVANDFIAMLREACAQTGVPIYVVVTMRSDFIGDCSRFEGLAEAVNRSEFLIPRLSREQFKSAIEGPIRVAGGQITPRLMQRLLNDVGDEQDQLPCLQHALMRTWRVWQGRAGAEALDLEDYAQVGKMSQALSLHADEIYLSLAADRQRELCAAMFKALTVEGSEKRGIRRPRRLQALGRILGVEKTDLLPVIDAFRQPEVSFLMPPADVELRDSTVIDLSHESLMRVWTRLRGWVDEEAQSVGIFRRLSESAALWRQGRTGLCRDPELAIARAWLQSNRPNAAWAEQYAGNFDEAMAYLQASADVAEAEVREREDRTRAEAARKTRRLRWLVGGLAAAVVVLGVGGAYGLHARQVALRNASRTDAAFASRLLESGNTAEGLAYFVRAAREDRHNAAIAPHLVSALVSHNFLLPQGAPLLLPAPVVSLHYAADGGRVWVLTDDGVVRVVDPRRRSVAQEFRFPSKIDRVLFPAENDRVFVAVFADHSLQTRDAATGKPVSPLMRIPSRLDGAVLVSQDGRWLAALSESKVFIRDTANGRALSTLDLGNRIPMWVAFSPDGSRVLTCAVGGTARQWSTLDGSPLRDEIPAPSGTVGLTAHAAYSRDGRRFAVGWINGGAQLFDTATNRRISPVLKQDVINDLWFSPDGQRLFTIGSDRAIFSVHRWDAFNGAERARPWSSARQIRRGVLSRDHRIALTVDFEGAARIWDFALGKELAEPTPAVGRNAGLALSADGTSILVASGTALHFFHLGAGAARPLEMHRGALNLPILFLPGKPVRVLWPGTDRARVLELASGREIAGGFAFPKPILPLGKGSALRGDGGAMVVALQGASGEATLAGWEAWMINGGAVPHTVPLAGVPPVLSWVRFSPTGNLVAIVSSTSRDAIRVWDLSTGQPVAPAMIFDSTIFGSNALPASFSADGKLLVAGTVDGSARIWDVVAGRTLFDLGPQEGRVAQTAFSPDGTRLAIGAVTSNGSSIMRIWDVPTGRLVHEPVVLDGSAGVASSDDGRRLITWSWAETRVWDARTGEPMGETISAFARAAHFSHDGRRIATAGSDSVARVWDAQTFEPVTEPLPHPGVRVTGVEFSPDDRWLRTETSDDRFLFWSIPPSAGKTPVPDWLLDLATLCIGRRLTAEGRLESALNQSVDVSTIRRTLAALPADAPYVEWGRWFLADRATRSIAPGFTITQAEADELAQESTTPAAAEPPPTATAAP